jgi:hypothetical protein
MILATDTFLSYLAKELAEPANLAIPVHWVRQSPQDENADKLKNKHLNVRFLGFFQDGSIEWCLVSLDLLWDDERTALGHLKKIRDLLLSVQVVPEKDFVANQLTGRAVSWNGRAVRFIPVRTPSGSRYIQYNATFPLMHTRE